jgi:predicted porin
MKKLLIATAALAMVAGTAQAQSSVQVYGLLDMGYSDQKTTDGKDNVSDKNKQINGKAGLSGSRLGFKGTEDLGGGLKAGFVYELGLNTDAATAGHSVRAANVSLNGGFGDLTLGRVHSVGKKMNDEFTAFSGGGSFTNGSVTHVITGNAGTSNLGGNATKAADNFATEFKPMVDRISNAVAYTTPVFGGVSATVELNQKSSDASELEGKTEANSSQAIRLNYVAGKLAASIAYTDSTSKTEQVLAKDGVVGTTTVAAVAPVKAAAATKVETELTQFGLKYDFGVARVFATYVDGESQTEGATTKQKTQGGDIGVIVPVSAKVNLLASVGQGDYKYGTAGKTEVDGYMLQAHYALSKRTTAYAIYGQTEFSDNKGTVGAVNTDYKDKLSMIGVRHSF